VVNKLFKMHMAREHGQIIPNDPSKMDNTTYVRGASKHTQKDQPTEFKKVLGGKDVYSEIFKESFSMHTESTK
jgi:hypothetical protein